MASVVIRALKKYLRTEKKGVTGQRPQRNPPRTQHTFWSFFASAAVMRAYSRAPTDTGLSGSYTIGTRNFIVAPAGACTARRDGFACRPGGILFFDIDHNIAQRRIGTSNTDIRIFQKYDETNIRKPAARAPAPGWTVQHAVIHPYWNVFAHNAYFVIGNYVSVGKFSFLPMYLFRIKKATAFYNLL